MDGPSHLNLRRVVRDAALSTIYTVAVLAKEPAMQSQEELAGASFNKPGDEILIYPRLWRQEQRWSLAHSLASH
jgi:hypothetical protein